jgi:glycosyltransferase involved in cell wall biosynthesis
MTSIDKISRAAPTLRTERRRALRDLDPSLGTAGVWLIVPCYKVKAKILEVIAKTPPWIEGIVCVDDACPEGSGDFIEANNKDPRVTVVRLPQNQGVGGATLAGYAEAVARGGRAAGLAAGASVARRGLRPLHAGLRRRAGHAADAHLLRRLSARLRAGLVVGPRGGHGRGHAPLPGRRDGS